jgi:hypothetical protein
MEEYQAGTDYWACESDNGRHRGEAVYEVEHSRGDAAELVEVSQSWIIKVSS